MPIRVEKDQFEEGVAEGWKDDRGMEDCGWEMGIESREQKDRGFRAEDEDGGRSRKMEG